MVLLKEKLNRLEKRYVEEDIEKDLYIKYKELYESELKELDNELRTSSFSSSNLESAVKKGIKISKNAKTELFLNFFTKFCIK